MSDNEKKDLMNEPVAIRVDHVKKTYLLYDKNRDRVADALGIGKVKRGKPHNALNDVSFEVHRGEAVGIIGTNGSGKSTILKIITGVLNATEGTVTVDGRISALLELGAGFNMEYTGVENVYLNGTMIGFTKEEIDAKLDSILEFADIGDFVYQPVKTYSSGMFVRLAFAVAINIEPEILIVDEALSVGDLFFQNKCYKKFEEFKNAGKTVLFVSHDLSSVAQYCDRVVLLNKGDKLAEGTPKEMIDLYKRVLVGQLGNVKKSIGTAGADGAGENGIDVNESGNNNGAGNSADGSNSDNVAAAGKSKLMRDLMEVNPDIQEYGDQLVEIVDFGITDDKGEVTNTLIKGTDYSVKIRIRANTPVDDPIVAFTIRDVHGKELCGTNTMYENTKLGHLEPGDEKLVTFTQKGILQGGQYLVALGCTRYENDSFKVYHRYYDACSLTVIAERNTIGCFDMYSEVTIE